MLCKPPPAACWWMQVALCVLNCVELRPELKSNVERASMRDSVLPRRHSAASLCYGGSIRVATADVLRGLRYYGSTGVLSRGEGKSPLFIPAIGETWTWVDIFGGRMGSKLKPAADPPSTPLTSE